MRTSSAIAQLRTTDLAASIRFYTTKVGLTLAFQHQDFYAGIRSGDQIFHLKLVDEKDPSIGFVDKGEHFHLYLETDDAAATAYALKENGVRLVKPVHDTAWGTREFVIKDDQGHTLYFGETLKVADTAVGRQEKTVQTRSILDLKTFVPAKDHDLARQFYIDLGFKLNWGNGQVAEFEAGAFRFLLQNFYVQQYVENFMMQLMVDDADDWWQRIEKAGLMAKYPGITVKPPTMQPWGLRVLYLTDPSGVLWHIADRRPA